MQFTARTVVFCIVLVPVLILLPILLWKLDLPFISSTSGPEYRVFEIFAFCVAVTAVTLAAFRLKRTASPGLPDILPTALFTLLGCWFVAQITEFRPQSSDWMSYERAARALLAGTNPYVETGYLYPPLTASALATTYKAVMWGSTIAGITVDPAFAWQGVFYLYQCCQFFLVMAAIALCFRLATALGADPSTAALLVGVVFLFNIPLLRTLYFHQVNLWVFTLMMCTVLFPHRPFASGIALAVAIHLKLYAGVLAIPFLLMRRFTLIFWACIGTAVIVLIQIDWGLKMEVWRQYLSFAQMFPAGTTFRDNSLHSMIHNTLGFLNILLAIEPGVLDRMVQGITALVSVGVVGYFWKRYKKREEVFRALLGKKEGATLRTEREGHVRAFGHFFDAIAMALLISPLVWEHHYILAVPFIVYAALTRDRQQWPRIGTAAFLMLALPIFDVFPFSYHRAAGLVLLLWTTHPQRTREKS